MNRVLLRTASLCAHRLLLSPAALKPGRIPPPVVAPLADWTLPRFRFFSSENDSGTEVPANAPETDLVPTESKESSIDVPDVSNKGKFAVDAGISLVKVVFWMFCLFFQLCLPLYRVENEDREVLQGG